MTHPLKRARLSKGWTQSQLAEQVGVNPLEVGRWERGEAIPHQIHRLKLCHIFDQNEQQLSIEHPTNKEVQHGQGTFFLFNEDLSSLDDFYGRERERRRLLERTRKRAATAIIGNRRSGKTWLFQYLRLATREQSSLIQKQVRPQFLVGYLNINSLIDFTVTGFIKEVLQQFGLQQENPSLTDLHYALRTLQTDHIPVLCIDRFELLANRREVFTEVFYQGLRAMSSMLTLIVLSRKPLAELFSHSVENQESGWEEDLTSPFSGIFEQITLRPFNHGEARHFIEKKAKAADLSQDETPYFWEYGVLEAGQEHWSPVLLQMIGAMLVEDKPHYNMKDPNYQTIFEQRFKEMRRGLGKL